MKRDRLPARRTDMRATFNLLRANDLIWNYVVSSWLMGEEPPAFDLLTWNADSTRMPAEMHSSTCAAATWRTSSPRGVMEMAGQRLDMASGRPGSVLPGRRAGSHRAVAQLVHGCATAGGDVRFVLSNSGHIAGIVNPPNPKSIHRVLEGGRPLPEDPG